jgi:hypothetical protein
MTHLNLWGPFLLTALSWLVQWQCGSRPRVGWLLCCGANFVWIAYAGLTDQPGFFVGAIVTSMIALRNYRRAGLEAA